MKRGITEISARLRGAPAEAKDRIKLDRDSLLVEYDKDPKGNLLITRTVKIDVWLVPFKT